jgi:hypothetical protein
VTFSLSEFNLKKQISWACHMDDRSKSSSTYDMIIGNDIISSWRPYHVMVFLIVLSVPDEVNIHGTRTVLFVSMIEENRSCLLFCLTKQIISFNMLY